MMKCPEMGNLRLPSVFLVLHHQPVTFILMLTTCKKKKKILLFFSFIGRERHQSQLDNLLSCDKSTDPMTSTSIRKTFHCPAGLLCSSQSVPTLSINTASLLIHIQSFHLF